MVSLSLLVSLFTLSRFLLVCLLLFLDFSEQLWIMQIFDTLSIIQTGISCCAQLSITTYPNQPTLFFKKKHGAILGLKMTLCTWKSTLFSRYKLRLLEYLLRSAECSLEYCPYFWTFKTVSCCHIHFTAHIAHMHAHWYTGSLQFSPSWLPKETKNPSALASLQAPKLSSWGCEVWQPCHAGATAQFNSA